MLVVDDDPGSLLVAQAAVEQSGHECLTASDGDSAWNLYQTRRPQVVVTDLQMPGMEGLSLCRAIRAAEGDTYAYLVLVTSQGSREDVLAGMEAGALGAATVSNERLAAFTGRVSHDLRTR